MTIRIKTRIWTRKIYMVVRIPTDFKDTVMINMPSRLGMYIF